MTEDAKQIDAIIGNNIKKRRLQLDLTQTELGKRLGLSRQLVQKYEDAHVRVPAAAMYRISQALDVSLDSFFEGINDAAAEDEKRLADMVGSLDEETVKIIEALHAIKDPRIKEGLLQIYETVLENSPDLPVKDIINK